MWLSYGGPEFDKKCAVQWCHNRITAFSFHVGHVVAESKGGPTVLENLIPLCPSCNLSMGSRSVDEWSKSVTRASTEEPVRGGPHANTTATTSRKARSPARPPQGSGKPGVDLVPVAGCWGCRRGRGA